MKKNPTVEVNVVTTEVALCHHCAKFFPDEAGASRCAIASVIKGAADQFGATAPVQACRMFKRSVEG